jgi:hypothetical protein
MAHVVYQVSDGFLYVDGREIPFANIVMEPTVDYAGVDCITLRSAGDSKIWMARVPVTDIKDDGGLVYADLAAWLVWWNALTKAPAATTSSTTGLALEDGGNLAEIKTLLEDAPTPATGTVALATSRLIPTAAGVKMNRHKISIQLLSANLSAPTTFSPEGSQDGTNWDVLTVNETDITHTLADDAPFYRTYELDKDSYIRWNMAGETTGDVAFKINN